MPSFQSPSFSARQDSRRLSTSRASSSAPAATTRRSRSRRTFMSQSHYQNHDTASSDEDVEERGLIDPSYDLSSTDPFDQPDHHTLSKPSPRSFFFKILRRPILLTSIVLLVLLLVFKTTVQMVWLRLSGVPPGLYSKQGRLVLGHDTNFSIKGASWFGMEEPEHHPGGLMKTGIKEVLLFLKDNNFNAIRIPLSVENILANPKTNIKKSMAHLNINGSPYLDLLRTIVQKAADLNILILLDIHRLHNSEVKSPGLWYTVDLPESRIIQAWRILCKHLDQEWNILGADLKNEPWNSSWHTADPKTDWKRASEVLGSAVQENCPSWTIFVEGIGTPAGKIKEQAFWSENLAAMQDTPPAMSIRKKVVLSPHVYGPSVYMQPYFKPEGFLNRMPAIWDDHFGRANKISGLATVIGEWGGKFEGKDEAWQRRFFQYISNKGFGFFYWCINPESGDTGGLLKDNWKTPEYRKLELLKTAPSTSVAQHIHHFQYFRKWRVA